MREYKIVPATSDLAWAEALWEIALHVDAELKDEHQALTYIRDNYGYHKLYLYGLIWANEFEKMWLNNESDDLWWEAMDDFMEEKLDELNEQYKDEYNA